MRKPIRIDWDALEEAFSRPRDEVAYLDSVTGRVVLEGEGERDDFDDDGGFESRARTSTAPLRDDPTLIKVTPPEVARKVEWMRAFLGDSAGFPADVVAELESALSGSDPAGEVPEILNRNPDVRDAWYVYRSDRLHELIEGWVEDNGIAIADPPPWR